MVYPRRETKTDHGSPSALDMASEIKVCLSSNVRDAKTVSKTAGLQDALGLVINPEWVVFGPVVFRSVMLVGLCGNSNRSKARFPLSPRRHSVLRVPAFSAQRPEG